MLDDNKIIGCIMLGDTKTFNKVTKLMSAKTDVTAVKDEILKEEFDFSSI